MWRSLIFSPNHKKIKVRSIFVNRKSLYNRFFATTLKIFQQQKQYYIRHYPSGVIEGKIFYITSKLVIVKWPVNRNKKGSKQILNWGKLSLVELTKVLHTAPDHAPREKPFRPTTFVYALPYGEMKIFISAIDAAINWKFPISNLPHVPQKSHYC